MRLISPSEISARILTLLDESDERVILVSPYIKISKWFKMQNKINALKARRIHTEIYVRDDPENTASYQDLDQLALNYKKIPHLHCKLYLNEKRGIVTSMNLLLSSEINSLEIGYETENWNEYNNLYVFYSRYIRHGNSVHPYTEAGRPVADLKAISNKIKKELNEAGKNSWIWNTEKNFHISTGRNLYIISIIDTYLRITARIIVPQRIKMPAKCKFASGQGLRGTEQGLRSNEQGLRGTETFSQIAKKVADLTAMNVQIISGPMSEILEFSGQAHYRLESTSITTILEAEAAMITEQLISFIMAADDPA